MKESQKRYYMKNKKKQWENKKAKRATEEGRKAYNEYMNKWHEMNSARLRVEYYLKKSGGTFEDRYRIESATSTFYLHNLQQLQDLTKASLDEVKAAILSGEELNGFFIEKLE